MASNIVDKPAPDYELVCYAIRKRIERNIERLRALSDLTDVIKPLDDTDAVVGAFGALIDAVADDLERLTAREEEAASSA